MNIFLKKKKKKKKKKNGINKKNKINIICPSEYNNILNNNLK